MVRANYRSLLAVAIGLNVVQLTAYLAFSMGGVGQWGGQWTEQWTGQDWPWKPTTIPLDGDVDRLSTTGPLSPVSGVSDTLRVGRGVQTGGPCGLCRFAPELCDELGEALISQSVAFSGSNERLWRTFARMSSGEPWTMAVVGGSVSWGHGIPWGKIDEAPGEPRDPRYRKPNMYRQIFDELNALFPAKNSATRAASFGTVAPKEEGVNSLINGAQGGSGSGYFSYCFAEHIPLEADLVFVEMGVNDEVILDRFESYEFLLRGLLGLPKEPAVVSLEAFSLMFATIGFGAELHRGLNQYYDVPSITLRGPYLPLILANNVSVFDMFYNEKDMESGVDLRHISVTGHHKLAGLAIAYLHTQLCALRADKGDNILGAGPERAHEVEAAFQVPRIPRIRLMQKYNEDEVLPPVRPSCFSMNSDKNKLVPTSSDGWREWNWKLKHYLIADQPGSRISFNVSTTMGNIVLHYQRSMSYGFGQVHCGVWIDGDKDRAVNKQIDGWWAVPDVHINQEATWRDIPPGDHVLSCLLLKETHDPQGRTEFRIVSVTSI